MSDFNELMKLAEKGDESQVDKTVGDIYGREGCEDLNLPASLTAANFGRLATKTRAELQRDTTAENMTRAVLRMVAQASVVLAKAFASHEEDAVRDRVFFVGTFVGAEENGLARRMISDSMAMVGCRALFCRHAEYLGALGSLSKSFLKSQ